MEHVNLGILFLRNDFYPTTSQPNPDENYEITTNTYTPHDSTRYMNVVIGSNGKAQSKGKKCEKDLPELYNHRADCCGCTACYAACPVSPLDKSDKCHSQLKQALLRLTIK